MWQMIVKGICGGVGGGLKAAGANGTNLSGGMKNTEDSQSSDSLGSGLGNLVGSVGSMFKKKEDGAGAVADLGGGK